MPENEPKSPPDSVASNSGERGAAASATANIHDRLGVLFGAVSLILSSVALGMTLQQPGIYSARIEALTERVERLNENKRDMETKFELARMEIEGFKNAMHAHGIKDLRPHLPGEPD